MYRRAVRGRLQNSSFLPPRHGTRVYKRSTGNKLHHGDASHCGTRPTPDASGKCWPRLLPFRLTTAGGHDADGHASLRREPGHGVTANTGRRVPPEKLTAAVDVKEPRDAPSHRGRSVLTIVPAIGCFPQRPRPAPPPPRPEHLLHPLGVVARRCRSNFSRGWGWG